MELSLVLFFFALFFGLLNAVRVGDWVRIEGHPDDRFNDKIGLVKLIDHCPVVKVLINEWLTSDIASGPLDKYFVTYTFGAGGLPLSTAAMKVSNYCSFFVICFLGFLNAIHVHDLVRIETDSEFNGKFGTVTRLAGDQIHVKIFLDNLLTETYQL